MPPRLLILTALIFTSFSLCTFIFVNSSHTLTDWLTVNENEVHWRPPAFSAAAASRVQPRITYCLLLLLWGILCARLLNLVHAAPARAAVQACVSAGRALFSCWIVCRLCIPLLETTHMAVICNMYWHSAVWIISLNILFLGLLWFFYALLISQDNPFLLYLQNWKET